MTQCVDLGGTGGEQALKDRGMSLEVSAEDLTGSLLKTVMCSSHH